MKWFKHQSDARNSLKLRKVRRKYGADGYAIYWFCLEAIAYDVDKDNLTFELKEDAETIAFELNIQEKRVEEIMYFMVEIGLFESSSNMITCMKLAESIDKSMTNSPKMRAWLETKSVMTLPDKVIATNDCVNTCPELEVEKKKKRKNTVFSKPSVDEIQEYFNSKGYSDSNFGVTFFNHYESNGWMVGKTKMKSWTAAVTGWITRGNYNKSQVQSKSPQSQYDALQEMNLL